VEGGGRQDDIRHTSYRGVVGIKGEVFDDKWTYDIFGQYGTVVYQETYNNDFSIPFRRCMDVVATRATRLPICVDNRTRLRALQHLEHRRVTPEALAYLQTPGFQRGDMTQTVVGA
jgi:hypothetical protein